MIKHSHLSFSTAAPCVQARLASPIHPRGTLDAPKILFRVQIYNTSVQPICTSPKKKFKFLLFFLRIAAISQTIAFFVGFGGGIL